jgi:hypothetical protein
MNTLEHSKIKTSGGGMTFFKERQNMYIGFSPPN